MEMFDAVQWENLRGKPGAKAGYIDGPVSEWPPEAWREFEADPLLHISVLANPAAECFDREYGDANAADVATACAVRAHRGEWSVVYVNGSLLGEMEQALLAKGLRFTHAEQWPAPHVYLACADPTGHDHLEVTWAPVQPIWVQWGWEGGYDQGTTWGEFPKKVLTPPAPPAGEGVVTVQVPELKNGDNGVSVQAVQKLVGGLVVDGIFGSQTDQAVRRFQSAHGLAVDGIVGEHTWGALVGHPQ